MRKLLFLITVLTVVVLAANIVMAFGSELYPGETELWKKAQKEGIVFSYDTGPTWANWKGVFEAFKERYQLDLSWNDIGSGTTVVRLEKEKANPQADTAYYFMPFGELAKTKNLTQVHKPNRFGEIPKKLKDPAGNWFSIHMGTVCFVVNKRLVKNSPQSWNELLKSEYKRNIVYLDPRTTGIGYAIMIATTLTNGGDLDNLEPGAKYLGQLQEIGNVRQIEKTTPYNKFIKGEIPIWITYDFNAYRAKYTGGLGDDVEIIIPMEGSITAPYAISMVNDAPHPSSARLWLNFILSEEGQKIFAEGYVRPVLNIELPASVKDKFLPAKEYKKASNVDWVKAQEKQSEAAELWTKYVLGG